MKPLMKTAIALTLIAFPAMALDATPTVIVEPNLPGQAAVVVETPATLAPAVTYTVPGVAATAPVVTYGYAVPGVVTIEPPAAYAVPEVVAEVVAPAPSVAYVVPETPAYTPWPEVPGAIRVMSADLVSAFAVNEFSANDIYRGNMVETWGKVVRVYRDEFGMTSVEMSPSGLGGGYTLKFRVQPGEIAEAELLAPGQSIFAVGLCEGVFRSGPGDYAVLLVDSVLFP